LVITTNPSKPSQKYAETITVMTYANIKDFESWKDTFNTVNQPNTRSFTYEQYKDFWVKHIIDKMEKHFPNFREAIKSYYTSTPLTYRDYIGLEDGNMYGFQKQAHQSALTQIFPRTKVNNLFLVGQNVRLHGILGVTISAFHLAKEYLGTERFLDIIKTEHSLQTTHYYFYFYSCFFFHVEVYKTCKRQKISLKIHLLIRLNRQ